jgi:hypothetical protein
MKDYEVRIYDWLGREIVTPASYVLIKRAYVDDSFNDLMTGRALGHKPNRRERAAHFALWGGLEMLRERYCVYDFRTNN